MINILKNTLRLLSFLPLNSATEYVIEVIEEMVVAYEEGYADKTSFKNPYEFYDQYNQYRMWDYGYDHQQEHSYKQPETAYNFRNEGEDNHIDKYFGRGV